MNAVIIAAAGQGKRMGSDQNKVFLSVNGSPMLVTTVRIFDECPEIDCLVIVAAPEEVCRVKKMLNEYRAMNKPWQVVAGGKERQYSIANALEVVPTECEIILVHDGARPLIEQETIHTVINTARQYRAAGVAVPVKDTIKKVDLDGFICETPDRTTLWAIQTPQAFEAALLRQAYQMANQDGYLGTDDAMLVERLGVKVKIVHGSYSNLKVTTPEDIFIARALTQRGRTNSMRIGMGYDVHQFADGRKLILGGVEIPYDIGLLGHSDADVLLHAIKDAILGAAALGDIGRHFPDNDLQYKGASSLWLLEKVRELVASAGWVVHNLDATVVAEKPKLASYIPEMNQNIARALAIDSGQVNVKATTTEGLGFTGRREGIAAYAVVTLEQII